MPRPRTAMRKIRDVLRLTFAEQLSRRQVSTSLGIPFTTICEYIDRSRRAGLSWPLPENLDDSGLESLLFTKAAPVMVERALPDQSFWNARSSSCRGRPSRRRSWSGETVPVQPMPWLERFASTDSNSRSGWTSMSQCETRF
jgi:hypothetical protein